MGDRRLDEPDPKEKSRAGPSTAQQTGARQGRADSSKQHSRHSRLVYKCYQPTSKEIPIWDIGLICIDLRDSDGALMWQCWACNDHRSILSTHSARSEPMSATRPMQPAQRRPASRATRRTALGRCGCHTNRPSSDTVGAVTAACSWCFTRARWGCWGGSAPHYRGQCILLYRIVSHGVAPGRIAVGSLCCWCCVLVLVLVNVCTVHVHTVCTAGTHNLQYTHSCWMVGGIV